MNLRGCGASDPEARSFCLKGFELTLGIQPRYRRDAVGEYVREAGQNSSFAAKIETAADLVAHIKASDGEFSAFRHKHERLFSTLKAFAGPITAIAKISISLASGVDSGAASSAVLGAIVHLLKACDGVSDAYDWVEQLFRELNDFSEHLEQYAQTPQLDPVLRRKIVAILAVLLKVIGRSQKLIREHRFREYLRVTFLGKDKTTKALIDELNRTLGSEPRYTVGVTYAATQSIEKVVKANQETLKENQEMLKENQETLKANQETLNKFMEINEADKNKHAQAEDKARLRNTLSDTSAPDDVEEIFVRNERALLQGTGAWLERESFFKAWMSREAVILWIFGGPGSGKSFLTTRLIQRLKQTNRAEEDPVAYFFVKENNVSLRDANILLKTLAWQIANQDDEFERHSIAVCRERSRTLTADLGASLSRVLQQLRQQSEPTRRDNRDRWPGRSPHRDQESDSGTDEGPRVVVSPERQQDRTGRDMPGHHRAGRLAQ